MVVRITTVILIQERRSVNVALFFLQNKDVVSVGWVLLWRKDSGASAGRGLRLS